jgi:putative intracellular protease/amidase
VKQVFGILLVLFSVSRLLAFEDDPQRQTEEISVAVYSDVGVGRSIKELLSVLEEADRLHVQKITAEDVRSGVLDGFDVVIHPGGSGSKQGKQLGEKGREAVRSFVRNGGGFIGLCAGAYLASADYPWSLHILDAKVLDRKHWARGTGTVQVGLSDQGRKILRDDSRSVSIYYGQGPLLAPAANPGIPDFIPLGTYETEIAKDGAPSGVMVGTTAIAAGQFGTGRVFCFSPHPEKTDGLGPFVHRAIEYVTEASD